MIEVAHITSNHNHISIEIGNRTELNVKLLLFLAVKM